MQRLNFGVLIGVLTVLILVLSLGGTVLAAGQQTTLDISQGNIIISPTGYSLGANTGQPNPEGYLITQTGGGSTANTITITGGEHDITIDNITIQASANAAIEVQTGAAVSLTLSGTNSLSGGDGFAGISVAAAWAGDGSYDAANSGQLILLGSGQLTATGGKATGRYGAGAGIGGDGFGAAEAAHQAGGDFGQIIIENGQISAYGGAATLSSNGAGAGIGGGGVGGIDAEWIYAGSIVINGGTIEATGGDEPYATRSAAGIGLGSSDGNYHAFGDSLTIEITNGNVTATGGTGAAGIGGGTNASSGGISISGGTVKAFGKADSVWGGAGIGGGDNGLSGPIKISGTAAVTAVSKGGAAGIGGGSTGRATEIIIEGQANVTAIGSQYGAGIGAGGDISGYSGVLNCGKITINSSGTVTAYGGAYSQAIGVGYGYDYANADYTANKLTVGPQCGTVWLLTKSRQLAAFWGQNEAGDGITDGLVLEDTQAIWYTLPNEGSFPAADALTNAYTSNKSANYQWSFNAENSLSILQDANLLHSYQYQQGFTLGNWAAFIAAAPAEQVSITYQWAGNDYPDDVALPAEAIIEAGTAYTAAPAPPTAEQYRFDGWFTNAGCTEPFIDGTIVGAATVLYGKWVYTGGGGVTTRHTITASGSTGGAIEPSGKISVKAGGNKTFIFTAAEGYKIADIIVDGKSVGMVSSYTFTDISSSHTIEALFAPLAVASPDATGVSQWLNTVEHIKYWHGYPDGTFRPENSITRAEAAQIFYSLLKDKSVSLTKQFADVAADAWYSPAVNALASLNIITGADNTHFAPDAAITRAEFTAMAMRFTQTEAADTDVFSDVSANAWYYHYVMGAAQYGWLTGYPDGTFRPESQITRAELAAIINRMLGRSADKAFITAHSGQISPFSDVAPTHWAYYDIMEGSNAHIYSIDNGVENWQRLI